MQWDVQVKSHLRNRNRSNSTTGKRRVRPSWSGHAGCEWNSREFLSSGFTQTHRHFFLRHYRRGDNICIFLQRKKNQKNYQIKSGEIIKLLFCESRYIAAFLLFPQERPIKQIQVVLEKLGSTQQSITCLVLSKWCIFYRYQKKNMLIVSEKCINLN